MAIEMEKAKVLNAFFAPVFTHKTCIQEQQVPQISGKDQGNKDLLSLEEDQIREHLNGTYARSCGVTWRVTLAELLGDIQNIIGHGTSQPAPSDHV